MSSSGKMAFRLNPPLNRRVRVFLGESKNGFVISDHSDHGASKELANPLWTLDADFEDKEFLFHCKWL